MAASTTATPSTLEAQLTGKARQLEEDHAKGMSEAERLREEVNRTRALRANRSANRSQKSISSMSGVMSPSSPIASPPLGAAGSTNDAYTLHSGSNASSSASTSTSTLNVQPEHKIKVHSSSYPVFTGRVNGPTSLANFIGGDAKIKGPVLNKARPPAEESLLTEEERFTPRATFLARNPALIPPHQQHFTGRKSPGVALPGMTRATPSPSPSSSSAVAPKSRGSVGSTPTPSAVEKSFTDPTPVSTAKSPLLSPTVNSKPAKPAYDRILSKSPAPMDKLSLSDKNEEDNKASAAAPDTKPDIASPRPIQAFTTPGLSAKPDLDRPPSPAADAEDTNSLGRLRGASIVKQRLQWGEAQKEASSSSSALNTRNTPTNSPKPASRFAFKTTPAEQPQSKTLSPQSSSIHDKIERSVSADAKTPLQTKRSSVLDRWNKDISNQNTPNSTSASPQASPKVDQTCKWPKPGYSRPVLGSKPSWSTGTTSSPKGESPDASTVKKEELPKIEADDAEKQPEMSTGNQSKQDVQVTEEPKTFNRPSTKPPWMQGNSSLSAAHTSTTKDDSNSTSAPPTRASSYPKAQLATSNMSPSHSFRSAAPSSPKTSKSVPSPSLPISVSPAPYVRSSVASPSSATSPRSSIFQPSATSYPVSLGVAPTHSRPLSLAHFIGGDKQVNGPVLNKVRPEESDSYGLETDATSPNTRVGTFLTHNPGVLKEMAMKKQRIPMPGMVPSRTSQSPKPKPELESEESVFMEKKGSNAGSLPLPGMESPKLPLPGEEPSSPPLHTEANQDAVEFTSTPSGAQNPSSTGAATLSSESPVLSEEVISRPTARVKSHEFEKRCNEQHQRQSASTALNTGAMNEEKVSPSVENPWAAIGSAMLSSPTSREEAESTIKPPSASKYRAIPSWEDTLKTLGKGPARHAPAPPSTENSRNAMSTASDPIIVRRPATRKDEVPSIHRSNILQSSTPHVKFDQYISVDVISVSDDAKNATVPTREQHIFYSTELLAIVLRSKHGGLVTTELLVWKGKHCSEDGREKVQELEKRYSSSAVHIEQGKENLQLVKALGGRIVTRQGFRNTFDVLNSALYRVRMREKGLTFIDEVDLQASSLCSAYTYIASVFQDLFVWYGRGTPDEESRIALQFSEELAKAGPGARRKVVHMLEGQESELWREIMGSEDEYAFANHWRFRLDNPEIAFSPTEFYDVTTLDGTLVPLDDEVLCVPSDGTVLIAKTSLECFVIVTPSARGDGQRIAKALQLAQALVKHSPRHAIPFRSPVHALILPSLIPRDLQALLRSSILEDLNAPHQPTTMNVVDIDTAWEHLGRETFHRSEILHASLLPVGVSPEMVQQAIS